MEYNSQGFTPEEVEKKLHLDLINFLLDFNSKSDKHYHDIHITTDGYCLIVEWTTNSYEDMEAGSFKFVDEDQVVMTEKVFPDNHTELCYNEADYKERLDEFLKENPGWRQTEYGRWVNDLEAEQLFGKDNLENNE